MPPADIAMRWGARAATGMLGSSFARAPLPVRPGCHDQGAHEVREQRQRLLRPRMPRLRPPAREIRGQLRLVPLRMRASAVSLPSSGTTSRRPLGRLVVSTKLPPAASQTAGIRWRSSLEAAQPESSPDVIAPRHGSETRGPLLPSGLYRIALIAIHRPTPRHDLPDTCLHWAMAEHWRCPTAVLCGSTRFPSREQLVFLPSVTASMCQASRD